LAAAAAAAALSFDDARYLESCDADMARLHGRQNYRTTSLQYLDWALVGVNVWHSGTTGVHALQSVGVANRETGGCA
jgi:hypothetical protein